MMFNLIYKGMFAVLGILVFIFIFTLSSNKVEWKNLSEKGDLSVILTPVSETHRSTSWTGEDVLRLAYEAAKGELILVIDGIQIDSEESLESVNLRGIIGHPYTVTFYTEESIERKIAVANIGG